LRTLVHRYAHTQICLPNFNQANRVASLDVDSEDDIQWASLIDGSWDTWAAGKLQERWVALKKKIDTTGDTHRGEYSVVFFDTDPF